MMTPEQVGDSYELFYGQLAYATNRLLAAQASAGQVHPDIEAVRYPDGAGTYLHRVTDAKEPEVVAINKLGFENETVHMVTGFGPKTREPLGQGWQRSDVAEAPHPDVPHWWYGDTPVYSPGQSGFEPRKWSEGRLLVAEAHDLTVFIDAVADALVPSPEAVPQPQQGLVARTLGRMGLGRRSKAL